VARALFRSDALAGRRAAGRGFERAARPERNARVTFRRARTKAGPLQRTWPDGLLHLGKFQLAELGNFRLALLGNIQSAFLGNFQLALTLADAPAAGRGFEGAVPRERNYRAREPRPCASLARSG
jgi:hypothetical protein